MVGKKFIIFLTVLISLILLTSCSSNNKIKIGITQFASHEALDKCLNGFKAALEEHGFGSDKVKFYESNAHGDVGTTNLIASELVNKQVDLILAIATPSAQAVKNAIEKTNIPLLFSAVTDPIASGLVPSDNVTGTSDKTPIDKQFALIKTILPKAKNIGFFYSLGEDNSLKQLEEAKSLANTIGFQIIEKGVTTTTELADAVEGLLNKVDVFYIPTDNLVASSMPIIYEKATTKGIAIIGSERAHVENGALITDGIDYYELGYQTGLMALKILEGKLPKEIPFAELENTKIVINLHTAKKLNIIIPETVLENAEVIEK